MRAAILTSGGDAPGMNACIRAVVRGCLAKDIDVFGVRQGYEGLLGGDFYRMDVSSVADIIHRGGTILRTARSERFMTNEGLREASDILEKFGIEALVVIGGNGSLTGAMELADVSGIRIFGIPGTIDNDRAYTDYSIGFDTAVNTVVNAIGNIRDTSSSLGRTTVIEVMGRNCGDIALHAGLAGGAETVIVPEVPYDIDEICRNIIAGVNRGKLHSIILKAEGIGLSTQALAEILQLKTGCETKTVILGYIQRGGSPTARDRVLASRLGFRAAELIEQGAEGCAVGIRGEKIIEVPFEEALAMKKEVPLRFLEICRTLL
ncbi:MAG: 6-phosphofructokinase [Firmicutes bacterium]|nr:6-phosphofructokinase [Bacillota bacterium]